MISPDAVPAVDAAAAAVGASRGVTAPHVGDDWCALAEGPLPVESAYRWALRPDCGAVVLFTGTARDHSEGRSGVRLLEYEAYEEQVVPRLEAVAVEARRRWPEVGRLVALHRTGPVPLTEAAVVVVASAPHRAEAFEAARWCIDTIKVEVPIWKREHWDGGSDWAQPCTHHRGATADPSAATADPGAVRGGAR